jgi:nucleoside-diphosphate-sugar epimerase
VIHAAAHRPRSYTDASEAARCLEVNAVATAKLVEDAIASGVRRFVYVSAGNVYRGMGRPAREDDPIWPSRRAPYYLASKICGEVFAAAAADRLAVTSVRPSAIYGPAMPPGMIPTFLAALREGRPVRVADGGRHRADLVHVDDVIDVLLALADAPVGGAEGLDAVNVGSGRVTTSLEVAEQLCDVLGAPRSLVEVDAPAPGAPPGFEPLDISRAARAFGYAPRALEEGLRSMVVVRG